MRRCKTSKKRHQRSAKNTSRRQTTTKTHKITNKPEATSKRCNMTTDKQNNRNETQHVQSNTQTVVKDRKSITEWHFFYQRLERLICLVWHNREGGKRSVASASWNPREVKKGLYIGVWQKVSQNLKVQKPKHLQQREKQNFERIIQPGAPVGIFPCQAEVTSSVSPFPSFPLSVVSEQSSSSCCSLFFPPVLQPSGICHHELIRGRSLVTGNVHHPLYLHPDLQLNSPHSLEEATETEKRNVKDVVKKKKQQQVCLFHIFCRTAVLFPTSWNSLAPLVLALLRDTKMCFSIYDLIPLLRIHPLHQGSASNVLLAFRPARLTPSATKIICRTFRMRGSAFCAQKNTIFYSCCKIQSMSLSLSDALVRYCTE